nr:non-structural maintenance of chromosomes element 1 homolog isoform X2 [Chlorocebus sabaeus]
MKNIFNRNYDLTVRSHMQGSTRRMGVMTDVHRRFLQLLMTHGVLEEWDVKRLQRHCYKVHDRNATVDKLEDFINNINSVLESLYIEIKRGVTEDDGRPIYALVNLATTSISKMATDFAENELDLFRKALELIIDSETGFASSTNILNLVDQLKGKKMRKKEAEQVLQKFVQNKWLIEVLSHGFPVRLTLSTVTLWGGFGPHLSCLPLPVHPHDVLRMPQPEWQSQELHPAFGPWDQASSPQPARQSSSVAESVAVMSDPGLNPEPGDLSFPVRGELSFPLWGWVYREQESDLTVTRSALRWLARGGGSRGIGDITTVVFVSSEFLRVRA